VEAARLIAADLAELPDAPVEEGDRMRIAAEVTSWLSEG
jgi:hypothetical protein